MLVTLLESKWWGIEVAGAFKAAMTLTRSATCARSRIELTGTSSAAPGWIFSRADQNDLKSFH